MKNLAYIILFFVPCLVLSQAVTENYTISKIYKIPISNTAQLNTVPNTNVHEVINYIDGLGRVKQSINVDQGGAQEDIVQHYEYDAFGRQSKQYLPYSSTNDF